MAESQESQDFTSTVDPTQHSQGLLQSIHAPAAAQQEPDCMYVLEWGNIHKNQLKQLMDHFNLVVGAKDDAPTLRTKLNNYLLPRLNQKGSLLHKDGRIQSYLKRRKRNRPPSAQDHRMEDALA